MTSRGGRAKHGRPRSLGVKANDYRGGCHRERGEQLAHPGIDVVTDVAHVGKRQINRILNVPVEVAAIGVDRAGVAASRCHHRVGSTHHLIRSGFGYSPSIHTPISSRAVTMIDRTAPAGAEPAVRTVTRSPASWRRMPAAR